MGLLSSVTGGSGGGGSGPSAQSGVTLGNVTFGNSSVDMGSLIALGVVLIIALAIVFGRKK